MRKRKALAALLGWLREFPRWLWDFPRPTWECWHSGGEGRSVHFRRRSAAELAERDNEAEREYALRHGLPDPGEDDLAYVNRGPWMRPSEVAALPEC
jgi:hypothetical protein